MAAVTLSREYSTLLSLTRDKLVPPGKVINNIFRKNVVLDYMRMNAMKPWGGGAKAAIPLLLNESTTAKELSTKFEALDSDQVDPVTTAFYDYATFMEKVIIAHDDIDDNMGDDVQLENLVTTYTDSGERALAKKINAGLIGGGVKIKGLVSDIVLNSGTLGEVDPATFTTWKAETTTAPTDADGSAGTSDLIPAMDRLFIECTDGNEEPDVVMTTKTCFQSYLKAARTSEQVVYDTTELANRKVQKMLDAGYRIRGYNGLAVFFDRAFTADKLIMVNTDSTFIGVNPKANFKQSPFVDDTVGRRAISVSLMRVRLVQLCNARWRN